MTKERFTETLSTGIVTDNVTGKEYKCEMRINDELLKLVNDLDNENEQNKTTIRMLEQQSQRQISRNERLRKDWDRLYQHLLDMGLMTDEEILKVVWND